MKGEVETNPEELQSMRMGQKQEQRKKETVRLLAASGSQPQLETALKKTLYIQPDTSLTRYPPNLPLNSQYPQLRDVTRCSVQPMGVRNLAGTEFFSCGSYYIPNPNFVFTDLIEGYDS